MNYTFDTNILLYIFREAELKYKLLEVLDLNNPNNILIISAVSIGELHALALKNKWGKRKQSTLMEFLEDFVVIPIDNNEITNIYAQIDAFSQGKLTTNPLKMTARNMGKNDLWIAATAVLTNSQRLTTDQDFSHLDSVFLDLNLIRVEN